MWPTPPDRRIAHRLPSRQPGKPHVRLGPSQVTRTAPVEALDGNVWRHAGRACDGHTRVRHFLSTGAQARLVRKGLQFDNEIRAAVYTQYAVQRWDSLAVARRLLGKLYRIVRIWTQPADVECRQVCRLFLLDRRPPFLQPIPRRIARDVWVQRWIVRHHYQTIRGQPDIQFQ